MNALRALLLLSTVAALVACGRSDRSGADARGVTVELPPFEPEHYAMAEEEENAATSVNVMVPAALEGEVPAAPKSEPPKPPAKSPEPEKPAPKAPPAVAEKAAAKASADTGLAPASTPAARADTTAPRASATARLPISTERVASTIDRIGFPCGQVTGASPVDGASVPTWRISCSSGATYRGTNRGGRMRFSKWSGN